MASSPDSQSTHDAIVVGAGHNGLVCAIQLARAGWRPLVLEGADRPGGAVLSEELTLPGFTHDVFSTNQNTFAGGPVFAEIGEDLERHGLRYATSSEPYANLFPDGTSLRVYTDQDRTLDGLRAHDPADAEGWAELKELFDRFSPTLLDLYGTGMPSPEMAAKSLAALRRLGRSSATRLLQLLLGSTRELGDIYLSSPEAKALLATWGMHLDFGPDVSGGSMFPFIEAFSDMEAGMTIVEGGASRMVDALVGYLEELGGEVRANAGVRRILVEDGRASGVELASGERLRAARAVIASTTPGALYRDLLPPGAVPDGVLRATERYTFGPATMMVHLALREPPRWAAGDELSRFAYLHIAPYVDDLADTYAASRNGLLPKSPLVIVGQTSAVDPTRAPDGQAVLWVQVRTLPPEIRGDAAGEIQARTWDDAAAPMADRVMAKLERYAPGLGELVIGRAVLSPADLERRDPNLVGGDSVSGSHHLRQNFFLRPLPGWSSYRTAVDGLFMTGASTWPGAGVSGVPGYLTAQRVLDPHPERRLLRRTAAGAAAVVAGGAAVGVAVARRARS